MAKKQQLPRLRVEGSTCRRAEGRRRSHACQGLTIGVVCDMSVVSSRVVITIEYSGRQWYDDRQPGHAGGSIHGQISETQTVISLV